MKFFLVKTLVVLCSVFLPSLLSGCMYLNTLLPSSVQKETPEKVEENVSENTPEKAPEKEVEKKYNGVDLVKALAENDSKTFLSLLPREIQENYGEVGFKKTYDTMCEILGKPISYVYLFDLEHPTYTVSIWKIRYERLSSDKQRKIYQESLFQVVSGKINGKDVILQYKFM